MFCIWSNKSRLWLLPLSWLYDLINRLVRLSYQLGFFRTWRAPVPIVIVGNLTVGGNGKTPMVIWLVDQLTRRGIRVGVVSRGYEGKSKKYPLLLHEKTTSAEAGDEPILIFQRTGVPVAVSPKRSEAVQALLSMHSVQIIISDDGLQHYALGRDKEIVVIDGIYRFGNGRRLPAGPMREPASRLRHVDEIIINGGKAKRGEISMRLRPGLAVNLRTGKQCEVSRIRHLVAMAGIGHPSRFFLMLEECGAKLEKKIELEDHQVLSEKQINKIISFGQSLIMTEKDAVKYRSFARNTWWYLPVYAELNRDKSDKLIRKLVSLVQPLSEIEIIGKCVL